MSEICVIGTHEYNKKTSQFEGRFYIDWDIDDYTYIPKTAIHSSLKIVNLLIIMLVYRINKGLIQEFDKKSVARVTTERIFYRAYGCR